jgi:hypothetical protein
MLRRLPHKYPIYRLLLWYNLISIQFKERMRAQNVMKPIGYLIISLCLLAAGCSKPKVQYGEIYKSDHGTNEVYYTRSYSGGSFWYWVFAMAGSSGSSGFSSGSSFSSGTWTRVPATSVPDDLKPTDKAVEEKEGDPTEDVVEKSTVADDEVVTETTTPEQESEMESSDDESSSESTSSASDEKASSSESESSSSSSSEESSSDESSSDSGGDSDDDN